jgi:hypothetical protein
VAYLKGVEAAPLSHSNLKVTPWWILGGCHGNCSDSNFPNFVKAFRAI